MYFFKAKESTPQPQKQPEAIADDTYEDPIQVSEKEVPTADDLYEESPGENMEKNNSKGLIIFMLIYIYIYFFFFPQYFDGVSFSSVKIYIRIIFWLRYLHHSSTNPFILLHYNSHPFKF